VTAADRSEPVGNGRDAPTASPLPDDGMLDHFGFSKGGHR
jgi:hypothetical protein